MSKVVVRDYNSTWPQQFEELRASIWPAVSDIAISVEHVGSTSVPGLAAKAVIDMDVVVDNDNVEIGIGRLLQVGYAHRGDLGVTGREAFFSPTDTPKHHLYLCPVGSPALANHLAIRDYLRANASAAREYGDLKRRLADEFADDIDRYIEGKTQFLVRILRRVGFPEGDVLEIEQMNRRS